MKKKLLTIFLVLTMTVSMAMMLTACGGNEHTHTFATEWTSDDVHHWYAATCEHTDEVSAKAEHAWGADDKCTVCKKEKPAVAPVYTVTEEEWTRNIEGIASMTNARVLAKCTGPEIYDTTSIVEIDDNRMRLVYMEPSYYMDTIAVKTGDNTYDVYERMSQTGEYSKIKETSINRFTDTLVMFIEIAQVAADKFANATFDETTQTYSLVLGNVHLSHMQVSGMECKFAFEDGILKSANIIFTELADDIRFDMDFTFGEVSIAIPEV